MRKPGAILLVVPDGAQLIHPTLPRKSLRLQLFIVIGGAERLLLNWNAGSEHT